MNHQEATGSIPKNPFSVLHFPQPGYPPRRILSKAEVNLLYQACETLKDRAMLALFYGCGLRKTEAIQLNTADIHFRHQLLYIRCGKGKKRRVVPMGKTVTKDLKNYYLHEREQEKRTNQAGPTAFMLNKRGDRQQRHWERIKYLAHQAGLPKEVSLHHLRHSIATHLLESGLSIEQVRDFLGHRYLESTQVYTRISKHYLTTQL